MSRWLFRHQALTLLACLAASQLTLMLRSSPGAGDYALMAALVWLTGGLLLLDRHEHGAVPPPPSRLRFALGFPLVLWCLLVLSFSARLYDPLLHALPLAGLLGLALVDGVGLRDPLLRQLGLLGLLPPLMVLHHAFGPSGLIAPATAQGSAFLIWLTGMPAVAEGIIVHLPHKGLEIGAGCTGLNTISLCLAAVVAFALLFPVFSLRRNLALAAAALVLALAINTVRVALLAFTTTTPPEGPLGHWRSFDFWHTGGGSHLFSLLAMAGVTGLYTLSLLALLRQRQQAPRS